MITRQNVSASVHGALRILSFQMFCKGKQALQHRFGPELMIMALLQLCPGPLLAQQGGLDYYAPRTGNNEITLFNNVQGYHLEPGRAEAAKGRHPAALEHYEFILRYYPNHPEALASLLDLCLKWKSRTCDADGWLKKGIERNPSIPQSYLLRGIYLHKDKRFKDAITEYQRALELDPDSVNAHYNLGLAYADLKEYELANKHAQLSYQLGANLPGLRVRLEKLGKWNPAAVTAATDTAKSAEPAVPGDAVKTK